ncbi:MAG: hypothetical protein ABR548_08450 [Actinomycetota bacterium]
MGAGGSRRGASGCGAGVVLRPGVTRERLAVGFFAVPRDVPAAAALLDPLSALAAPDPLTLARLDEPLRPGGGSRRSGASLPRGAPADFAAVVRLRPLR